MPAVATPGSNTEPGQGGPVRDSFSFPIRVYWEDTDAGGIVFYANYLKYFERARTEWLRSFGISQQALKSTTGGMFIVVETAVQYHAPAMLDDQLLVTAELFRCDRASLTMTQQVLRTCPGMETSEKSANSELASHAPKLICSGTIRIGWVEKATLRPTRIPPSLLEVLRP
jgi:acyl-CoA thioester hydrolase